MTIHEWEDVTVLDLGNIEIWDGADLSLLRETLTKLIEEKRCRSVGVNMRHVKYIPSGFFGMLFDWHEKERVAIHLYAPQAHVKRMLWFRQFFNHVCDDCHLLLSDPKQELVSQESGWNNGSRWHDDEKPESVTTGTRK